MSGAIALAVGAGFSVAGSMTSPTHRLAGAAAPRDTGEVDTGDVDMGEVDTPAAPSGAGQDTPGPASPPVNLDLRMPDGGPSDLVVPIAAAADGTLTPPAGQHEVGWWALGAAAGARHGTLLLAGHVDTPGGGTGAFGALSELRMGTVVSVTGADGRVRTYRITARRGYDRQRLPADLFTRSGPHRLALVTCGGTYDRKAGGYRRNLVLYGAPAPLPPATAPQRSHRR